MSGLGMQDPRRSLTNGAANGTKPREGSLSRRRRESSSSISLSRRLTGKTLLPSTRRVSYILMRVAAALVIVLLIYWIFADRQPLSKSETLKTKWWESDSLDRNQLLPKPAMLPKPPRPKPVPEMSHSLAQITRMSSTFKQISPSDWTAVVHISTAAQYPLLSTLIPSLLRQAVAPNRIILFAVKGLAPPIAKFGPSVSVQAYPPGRPPIVAFLEAVVPAVTTESILFVDGHLDHIDTNYVPRLLHASGTKEYRASLLASGGLLLPTSLDAPPTQCHGAGSSSRRDVDEQLHHQRSKRIHIPTSPFLFQASWMKAISNGVRTDIEIEAAIPLGLWTKAGIPAYALPVPLFTSLGPHVVPKLASSTFGCERLKRALQGVGTDRRIGPLFRAEAVGGGGLGFASSQAYGSKAIDDPFVAGKLFARDLGAIVILLSGEEELADASVLACGLAQENDVRVYVADLPRGKRAGGKRVLFDDADTGAHCHMDVHPLGSGKEGDSVSLAVLDELDSVGRVAVAIYLSDGHRGREFEEVLKWNRGILGKGRGGRRRAKKEMEAEKATVIISLDKHEMQLADWIAALPLDALRRKSDTVLTCVAAMGLGSLMPDTCSNRTDWHTPRIDISVVTNNRPASLHRLLSSLQSAHYFGDEVPLYLNLEQTADAVTQRLASDLDWPYGTVTVRHRIVLGGLMQAIVESWYPASNDTYGVFLEDDVEVSPMFYGWLKMTILYYRYSMAMRDRSTRLFGVSLYQQKFFELRPEGRQPFDAHLLFESLALDPTLPYLSQIPCSWGAVYFPEVWREFHLYLALRLSEMALPIADQIVPEIRSNKWPQSWKKYIIELVYLRGYVMLYPNYANYSSLSTNHVEKGTHIKEALAVGSKTRAQYEVPLMTRQESLLALPSGRLPSYETLPIIDLWGMVATDDDIIERGWQSAALLDSCPVPFRLDVPPSHNARELLCAKDYERVNRYVEAQPLAGSMKDMKARREKEAQQILRDREAQANDRIAAALAKADAVAQGTVRERPMMVPHPDHGLERVEDPPRAPVLRQPGETVEAHREEQEELARTADADAEYRQSPPIFEKYTPRRPPQVEDLDQGESDGEEIQDVVDVDRPEEDEAPSSDSHSVSEQEVIPDIFETPRPPAVYPDVEEDPDVSDSTEEGQDDEAGTDNTGDADEEVVHFVPRDRPKTPDWELEGDAANQE
ncbi:BQ2448_8107 [Microbotryum intermedium]|uniref:BQ2448_8107 protein n=1 Tax=Microbotryum intermedium TaxID=269621 RepID=A0A238FTB2_9BASI|nr:BQ2448_8107 [Microbotryum intermedium]